MAEDAGRDRPLPLHAAAVGEDGDVLAEVDGDADGLAQQPGALGVAADDGSSMLKPMYQMEV
jgi:hypothetical protein